MKKRDPQKTLRGYAEPGRGESFDDTTVPSAPPPQAEADPDKTVARGVAPDPQPSGAAVIDEPVRQRVYPPGGVAAQPPVPELNDAEAARRRGGTPMVEIEVVHEHGPAPRTDRPWRAVEIWTRNRVYTLDPQNTCIEVMDRVSRKVETEHAFIGARMVGGQHRDGDAIELSYPYPRPGSEAVFEQQGGSRRVSFSRTSAVTRVVIRLRLVTVAPSHVVPTWEEITNAFQLPKPKDGK